MSTGSALSQYTSSTAIPGQSRWPQSLSSRSRCCVGSSAAEVDCSAICTLVNVMLSSDQPLVRWHLFRRLLDLVDGLATLVRARSEEFDFVPLGLPLRRLVFIDVVILVWLRAETQPLPLVWVLFRAVPALSTKLHVPSRTAGGC